MDVKEAIARRRAYRSLGPVEITDDILDELIESARLAPSCFNNQPWRFVFVRGEDALSRMKETLSTGNAWATEASMIVAVVSRPKDDCIVKDRVYNLFDTGMATAFLILRATELGLVAHPIAGFSPSKVREALGIPEGHQVITLLIVGKKADGLGPLLSDEQAELERERPPRKHPHEIAFIDAFEPPAEGS
ncbi:MAG: nitroreductase family protein [Thermoplasmata archaeon]|nr:nitroreductase family protein [Thermoplasmata archaeon]